MHVFILKHNVFPTRLDPDKSSRSILGLFDLDVSYVNELA